MGFLSLLFLLFLLVTITSANFCFISMADNHSSQPYSPPPTPTPSSPPPTPKIQQPTSRTHPLSSTTSLHKHNNTSSTPSIPPPRRSRTHNPASTTSPHNTSSSPPKSPSPPTSRTHPSSTTSPHSTSSSPPKSPSPPTSRTHADLTTSPQNTSSSTPVIAPPSPHNTSTSTPVIAPPSPSRNPPASTTPPENTSSTPIIEPPSPSRNPPVSTTSPPSTSIPIMQVPETSRTPPNSTIWPPNTYSSTPTFPSQSTPQQEVSTETQEKQLLHIIEELIGAGNFASWAKFLASINPAMFPLAATLFVPSNAALTSLPNATLDDVLVIDPSLLEYHIVPQYLPFSELKQLPLNSRIPTLLSTNFIIITNTSSNFTIDDSEVTHPDLYVSSEFSVHGVSKILDYMAYGNAVNITFNGVDVADSSSPDVQITPVNETATNNEPNTTNHKHFPYNHAYFRPRFSGASSYSYPHFVMIFLLLGIALFVKID